MNRRFLMGFFVAAIAVVALLSFMRVEAAQKITICHISQGNGLGHVITVDDNSAQLKGHVNHAGDCVISANPPAGVGLPPCTSSCPISASGH